MKGGPQDDTLLPVHSEVHRALYMLENNIKIHHIYKTHIQQITPKYNTENSFWGFRLRWILIFKKAKKQS